MLQVSLLGQFEVLYDGGRLNIATRNAQALFAYLVLNPGQAHRRERLAGLLWPDSAEESARSNLRHELWRLRKALKETREKFLLVTDLTVAFDSAQPYTLDATLLEAVPVEGTTADELMTALRVYGGELLPGFYQEWVFAERERLQAAYEARSARLVELLVEERRWTDVQYWATRQIAAGGWPEAAYRALMLSHAATGDLPKAIATYDRLRDQIKAELGIQPSEQTRLLYMRLKSGELVVAPPTVVDALEHPGVPDSASVAFVAAPASPRSNLPQPLTSFIGRQKELAEVTDLIGRNRMVTIVGPGGVGKTRLAISAAAEEAGHFEDAAWWVELAPIPAGAAGAEDLVLQAIARALQLPDASGNSLRTDLHEYLRRRRLLLVMDNCEHLITACALIAESLLSEHPRLSILATSREPLRITGERILELSSLSLPLVVGMEDSEQILEAEAVQLFLQRANDVVRDYDPSDADLSTIASICRRLDGIPLAIELAAARLGLLSTAEIADRLDRRFHLLTGGKRTALPRHQTLLAAIEWSYDLLDQAEQTLLRRLSIFSGSFTLDAVEMVCGDDDSPDASLPRTSVLEHLGRLKDKSLLHVASSPYSTSAATRYFLLDTLCTFGNLKLAEAGETRAIRDRHLIYYVELVERATPLLFFQDQAIWSKKLREEYDNIRSSIEWAIESNQAEYGSRLVTALNWFWFSFLSMREGIGLARRILDLPFTSGPSIHRARLIATLTYLQWFLGERPANWGADLEKAVDVLRDANDRQGLAWALQVRGLVLTAYGEYGPAERAMQEGAAVAGELADDYAGSIFLTLWGDIPLLNGDRERAIEIYQNSANLLRRIGNGTFLAYPLRRLGYLSLESGQLPQAYQLFRESLILNRTVGDRRGAVASLLGMAALALKASHLEAAACLMGYVNENLIRYSNLLPMDQLELDRLREHIQHSDDDLDVAAQLAAGRSMTEEQIIELIETAFEDDKLSTG